MITPAAVMVSGRPGAPSTTPTPHRVSPGSTPSTRIPVTIPAVANTCSVATLPARDPPVLAPPRRVAWYWHREPGRPGLEVVEHVRGGREGGVQCRIRGRVSLAGQAGHPESGQR